ncbi:MAG: polysaccharide deacetylase [Tissierellia bacterium]|nr:polysaccharide deacetylase [Tissierellia bacterium]
MDKEKLFIKKKKRYRFIVVFIAIFILLFIGTSYKYNQKTASVVVAGDLSESILLMSEKSAINIALQQEKMLLEAKKAELEELERQERERQEKALQEENKNKRIAYLTFDDGPSPNVTPQILDNLKEYDIKATFFVLGKMAARYPDLVKRIHEEGHAIGNHTYSHNYNYIYRKTANFLNELEVTERILKDILGEEFETKIIRFPGGSFGKERAPFRKAVVDKGYVYYDWNSLNGDAEGHNLSTDYLVKRFKETFKWQRRLIVLMHDTDAKQSTVDALRDIIEYLQKNDYVFDTLSNCCPE